MLAKILIGSGILIVFVSIICVLGGIFSSFQALRFNESAGIGAVGGGLQFALLAVILFIVGLLFMVFGGLKLYRGKRAGKYL